jgi:hypothetical protein
VFAFKVRGQKTDSRTHRHEEDKAVVFPKNLVDYRTYGKVEGLGPLMLRAEPLVQIQGVLPGNCGS